jgi:hypothetical protein
MGGGRARPRPRGLSAVILRRGRPRAQRGKPMRRLAKAGSVGPAAVIVAASSRLPGKGGWRRKRKESLLRRSAVPRAVASARMAVRQLERASMMLGAVAAGLELVREIRIAGSNGTPSRGYSAGRSVPRSSSQTGSGRPAGRASRMGSSSGNRSSSKSPSRAAKKPSGNRTTAKKTRSPRTVATKRSASRAKTKKAGSARTLAKEQARARASAKRTRSPRSRLASG